MMMTVIMHIMMMLIMVMMTLFIMLCIKLMNTMIIVCVCICAQTVFIVALLVTVLSALVNFPLDIIFTMLFAPSQQSDAHGHHHHEIIDTDLVHSTHIDVIEERDGEHEEGLHAERAQQCLRSR